MGKRNKVIRIVMLVISIIFLLIGFFYQIPDREIPWNYKEYVGGDAYNIIIEASIRGGEIAGATVAKAIYIVFGISLLLISRIMRSRNKKITGTADTANLNAEIIDQQ